MRTGTLEEQGYRFTYRKGLGWAWRYEVLDGDIDAADMSDAEFTHAVKDLGE